MNTKYKIQNTKYWIAFLLFSIFYILNPTLTFAAEQKLTLTVTPPLFQLNIGPGEFWASSLKVVNANPYDLTLHTLVMNFEARGERGGGKFTPIIEDDPEVALSSLARWIEVSKEPIFVSREQSVTIPFSVRIPESAPPGGHYAAILVGTKPANNLEEGSAIQVSSFVSSLFFVRIKGDVYEEGRIREFRAEKTFYQKSDVIFTLRFENTGNVHLQPQGDIIIYNMWGKERGKILVNQKTHFGNVLPQSTRKFVFEWKGEENFFEAGMYKAIATLSFGKEARQNVFRTTYFWVVPLKPTLGILGGLIIFILFMMWAIRAYIRRALSLYQQDSQYHIPDTKYKIQFLGRPITEGIVDLRDIAKQSQNITQNRREKFSVSLASLFSVSLAFSKKYAKFFIFMVFFSIMITGLIAYFGETLIPARSFEVIIQKNTS